LTEQLSQRASAVACPAPLTTPKCTFISDFAY
jgi:hypothetical protein